METGGGAPLLLSGERAGEDTGTGGGSPADPDGPDGDGDEEVGKGLGGGAWGSIGLMGTGKGVKG